MQDCFAVGISLPKSLIKKIDDERGDIPRSKYVLRMLEKTCLCVADENTGKPNLTKVDQMGSYSV